MSFGGVEFWGSRVLGVESWRVGGGFGFGWVHGCGFMVLGSWCWVHGSGFMVLGSWLSTATPT
eukprot:4364863-Pyramimonas_sp.AAC.1